MALTIKKSMDIGDFAEDWKLITQLVESEYKAVEGEEGYYSLELVLIWDVDDTMSNTEALRQE